MAILLPIFIYPLDADVGIGIPQAIIVLGGRKFATLGSNPDLCAMLRGL